MNNSDKVKLINNSLVLDGISLKELSKIDIQKKDIIKFMNEEGFSLIVQMVILKRIKKNLLQ